MLLGVIGFILTIGILVTIHEWGHFYVARLCDVKILKFSLGFGRPLFSWRGEKDNTIYQISWIPLGGYVQMLGESGDEIIAHPRDARRTFQAKSAWKRFLIVFAGPAINLIFAWLAFSALYLYGVEGHRPVVAEVRQENGLRAGDIIEKINHQPIKLSHDAPLAWVANMGKNNIPVEIQRDGKNQTIYLDFSHLKKGDELDISEALGIHLITDWLTAEIKEIVPESTAEIMGLQSGDKILTLNGQPVDMIRMRKRLTEVPPEITLKIERNQEIMELSGTLKQRNGRPFLGVVWVRPDLSQYETTERYDVLSALARGGQKMVSFVHLTYQVFGRMLTNKASLDNLGGPITIGDMAGKTISYGFDVFLNFLGVVSLSLAAINLLPIPLLDGGHMVLYALEMVRKKALSERAMKYWSYFGMAILYSFMAFVLLKDFWKYLF